jgi:predicted restriction endonuclease
MKKISKKQSKKNLEINKIKSTLLKKCFICGKESNTDAAHILPKSIFPEYYTHPLNIIMLCRTCHNLFDNDLEFRKKQDKIYNQALKIDILSSNRYFKKNG